jgi:TonB family protein
MFVKIETNLRSFCARNFGVWHFSPLCNHTRQGIQGTVVLGALVAKDGTIESLVVKNQADPQLARSAVEAVSHWRYRPILLNGQPVAVETDISVVYSLQP